MIPDWLVRLFAVVGFLSIVAVGCLYLYAVLVTVGNIVRQRRAQRKIRAILDRELQR